MLSEHWSYGSVRTHRKRPDFRPFTFTSIGVCLFAGDRNVENISANIVCDTFFQNDLM